MLFVLRKPCVENVPDVTMFTLVSAMQVATVAPT